MKFSNRILSLLSCVAVLAVAPAAQADTISGFFWDAAHSTVVPCSGNTGPAQGQSGSCSGVQGAIPASMPSTATATATFTISNPNGPSLFNFFSSTDLSLSGFLSTGQNGLPNGDTVSISGVDATNINDGLFRFTGTTVLTLGELVNVTHDDGVNLYIDGTLVIGAASPTASGNETWTSTLSGVHNFTLDYVESNSAPAHLTSNILPTPEPSSLMLLGTGVLGAAGMLRRRLFA